MIFRDKFKTRRSERKKGSGSTRPSQRKSSYKRKARRSSWKCLKNLGSRILTSKTVKKKKTLYLKKH
jgi:hypothetical protein